MIAVALGKQKSSQLKIRWPRISRISLRSSRINNKLISLSKTLLRKSSRLRYEDRTEETSGRTENLANLQSPLEEVSKSKTDLVLSSDRNDYAKETLKSLISANLPITSPSPAREVGRFEINQKPDSDIYIC